MPWKTTGRGRAMYLDEKNEWNPQKPARPTKRGNPLTEREETLILWVVGLNLAAILIAPIGGASVVEACIALFAS